MKALRIAVFIFIVSFSIAVMQEVFGGSSKYVEAPVTASDIQEMAPPHPYGTNWWNSLMASAWFIASLPVHLTKILKVLWLTVMIGDLSDTMIYGLISAHLPFTLVSGLNALGIILVFLASFSIIRGVKIT